MCGRCSICHIVSYCLQMAEIISASSSGSFKPTSTFFGYGSCATITFWPVTVNLCIFRWSAIRDIVSVSRSYLDDCRWCLCCQETWESTGVAGGHCSRWEFDLTWLLFSIRRRGRPSEFSELLSGLEGKACVISNWTHNHILLLINPSRWTLGICRQQCYMLLSVRYMDSECSWRRWSVVLLNYWRASSITVPICDFGVASSFFPQRGIEGSCTLLFQV